MFCSDYNFAYTRRRFLRPILSDCEIRELEKLERLCFSLRECYDFRTLRLFVSQNGIGILRYYEESLPDRPLVAFHLFDCLAAELITLDVHPDFRRRGLATQLLKMSLQKLRSLGHTYAFCQIGVNNQPSLALHAKFGFRPWRVLKNYYGPGWHAYLLKAPLRGIVDEK